MKEFTVLMALVDMIPVAMFAIGSVMLQRDLYYNMSKGAFALFVTGTINVVSASFPWHRPSSPEPLSLSHV